MLFKNKPLFALIQTAYAKSVRRHLWNNLLFKLPVALKGSQTKAVHI